MRLGIVLLFCAVACADEVDKKLLDIVTTLCIEGPCLSKSSVAYVNSHRERAVVLIMNNAGHDYRTPTMLLWLGSLGPYKDPKVREFLIARTKDPVANYYIEAYQSLGVLAGKGDKAAKEFMRNELIRAMRIFDAIKDSHEPELLTIRTQYINAR